MSKTLRAGSIAALSLIMVLAACKKESKTTTTPAANKPAANKPAAAKKPAAKPVAASQPAAKPAAGGGGAPAALKGPSEKPSGMFALDKDAMAKEIQAKVAKLPKAQQGMAKIALAMIQKMDFTLDFKDGGKVKVSATLPSMGGGKGPTKKEYDGKWELKDGSVVISPPADQKGKKPLKCIAKGAVLSCSDGRQAMMFKKK